MTGDLTEDPATLGLLQATLEALDFEVIRHRLAEHVSFQPAKNLALTLTPSFDPCEVERLQRETVEGRLLLDELGDPGLHADDDASAAVGRAALEGLLTGAELLAVVDSLEVQSNARSAVRRAGRAVRAGMLPRLTALAAEIPDLQELERQIGLRIDRNGEVADNATPALRAIRRRQSEAYERVTRALDRIIQSSAAQESLQDQVVSVRGERLVIQIKSEMRSRIPGIVHDASNTGATLFVEPFATAELCNAWRELALEEQREVTRVLRDLSTLVGTLADDIRRGARHTADIDFILARSRMATAIGGCTALQRRGGPATGNESMEMRLLNVRHPLLGKTAVPISVSLGPDWSVLVVTGPNTGGKTVAMKTVGLAAAMHQSGLQVSADEGSVLPVFDGIYADVGDQQSIERSVSTFSSHMRRVIAILAEATPASLVLLDEIGASTDPEEGSALAKAILGNLASRVVPTVATTHHRSVAAFAEATTGMRNASVELDPSKLQPTYHLTIGVPGRSYAMSVAAGMGLPQEIMDEALSLLEPQHLRFEDWLNELQGERQQLQASLQEAEQARAQAEDLRLRLDEQLDYLLSHREEMLDAARRKMLSEFDEARRSLRRAEATLSWGTSPPGLQEAKEQVSEARQALDLSPPSPREPSPIAAGDLVQVKGLNLKGTVLSLPEQSDEAEVNIGNVKLRIGLSRLTPIEQGPEDQPAEVHVTTSPSLSAMEVDLRGARAEEALERLEDFLDKAVRDGLSSVRIIHGRGTGVLRQVVRERLQKHPLARSFEAEAPERGRDGATVVELA